jgi:hypothetical protein
VRGLDGRFELKAADAIELRRLHQQQLRFALHGRAPERYVLLFERREASLDAARRAPRFQVQQKREQSERLGLVRRLLRQDASEPDRLFRKRDAIGVDSFCIHPAFGISGVNRLQHAIQLCRPLSRRWNIERNARLGDALFRAHQPLTHRRRRYEKRSRDPLGAQAEHRLQHQRRARGGIDVRMRTREHEAEAAVGRAALGHRRLHFLDAADNLRFTGGRRLRPSRHVDQLAPGGGEQPGFRIVRRACTRPCRQRGGERI